MSRRRNSLKEEHMTQYEPSGPLTSVGRKMPESQAVQLLVRWRAEHQEAVELFDSLGKRRPRRR